MGFGIDKLKSWKRLTGYEVDIHGEIEYVCLTFGLRQNGAIRESGQIGGQIGGQMPENRMKIFKQIIENPNITRKEIAEKIGIASSAVQKHLEVLVKGGYIKREGKTKSSFWVIIKK
ncbi:MAG: winged helix-turn-helix transcriptional regulator [Bacteroidales bacterium]|nr:winged helix-turn-helix transcriptional regulator [Bacteroidales bacterium]